MLQTDLLSSVRFKIDPGMRRSAGHRGCVLLRGTGSTQQIVLTSAQATILTTSFEKPATVPEVLVKLLADNRCPPLNEYYELILQAHAAGVLLPEAATFPPTLAQRWRVRLAPRLALILVRPVLLLAIGTLIVAPRPWIAPAWNLGLLWGWFSTCALLSLGEILSACVLAGAGCEVRRPRLHWKSLFPYFRTDTDEAALGGPACERTVAIMRLTPLLAGVAAAVWFEPSWLAPLLAGLLYELAPTSRSAARQWLGAILESKVFTVSSGFLFEPRSKDIWVRFKVWWAGRTSRFGLLWIAWILIWAGLLGLVLQWLRPGLYSAVWHGFGPHGRWHAYINDALYAVAAVPVLATFFLFWALIRNWRIRRALTQPLRVTPTRIDTVAFRAGDNPTALRSVPLFRGLKDADLTALAAAMTPVEIAKRQVVFNEDDMGDAFYVVMEGQFEVLKKEPAPSRKVKTIGWLHPGDGFGEIALLDHSTRTTTIRATRPSRVLRLGKADFDQLVVGKMGGESVRDLLQSAAFLGRLTILGGWPFDDLLRYAQRCRSQYYPAGTQVLRQGEGNIWFFLVFDGAFEVRDGNKKLRRLQPGDYFGEISLLEHGTATADVVALEESRCLVMARADFLAFFARDYRIGMRIEALAGQRRGGRLFSSR
ncbi:MAG: cyclic nucleotide-binding domain-containing protein [Opitutaceae bacterium]|nr:cyclic nucleotide-binding domain-containing protein [Opitutaceae bacterium]MBP9911774.1 cyclic nucleotide-binding domain-containing protein [Opitutaceae bacterium]